MIFLELLTMVQKKAKKSVVGKEKKQDGKRGRS